MHLNEKLLKEIIKNQLVIIKELKKLNKEKQSANKQTETEAFITAAEKILAKYDSQS